MNTMQSLSIYLALALSAAAALMYEIIASDVLLHFFVESTFSIATVLSVFLSGLALGSLIYYYVQKRIRNRYVLFGALQVLIALYGYVVFAHIQTLIPPLETLGLFFVSMVILLVPTVSLGVIFPLTLSLVEDTKAGLVYFVDLVGAVIGSLLAGFYFIPELGNMFTVYVAVATSLLSAFLIFRTREKFLVLVLAVLLAVFYSPVRSFTVIEKGDVEFRKPSPFGEVSIEDSVLYIDGRDQCSWVVRDEFRQQQIVDEVFENINRPDAHVLNIGLGCGLTLERIVQNTTQVVDVVEINPVVAEANRLYSSLLDDQNVTLILEEGLHYLRNSLERYDSIIVDIENPVVVQSSDLYTVEAFEEIHDALVEGGIFGLWVNRCSSGEYSDVIFNSLSRAFTHVYEINDNIFIASDTKLPYNAYIPFTDSQSVNTLDHKRLSKIYFDQCFSGSKDSPHIGF